MAKEFYDVSYKTYHNERIKPVMFRGVETHPLYVQVIYDRRSVFFKSYYFELFAQPKYVFLETSIQDINELESRVIEHLINRRSERFDLDQLTRDYKTESRDILDSFDGSFKVWLGDFFREEGLPGLAAQMAAAPDVVAGIRLWDELKVTLRPDVFEKIGDAVVRDGHPYIPLATYVLGKSPGRPFCLPLYEWREEEKRLEIEEYLEGIFWRLDFGRVIRAVSNLFRE
jgi:hypothetical protein